MTWNLLNLFGRKTPSTAETQRERDARLDEDVDSLVEAAASEGAHLVVAWLDHGRDSVVFAAKISPTDVRRIREYGRNFGVDLLARLMLRRDAGVVVEATLPAPVRAPKETKEMAALAPPQAAAA